MIQIGRDIAGDCLITSGDVPGGPEMDIGCHGYDRWGGIGDWQFILLKARISG